MCTALEAGVSGAACICCTLEASIAALAGKCKNEPKKLEEVMQTLAKLVERKAAVILEPSLSSGEAEDDAVRVLGRGVRRCEERR